MSEILNLENVRIFNINNESSNNFNNFEIKVNFDKNDIINSIEDVKIKGEFVIIISKDGYQID